MKKYMDVFCAQNSKMELACGNPNCGHINIFNTRDVFLNAEFTFECSICHKTTNFSTQEFEENLFSELKKAGISVD